MNKNINFYFHGWIWKITTGHFTKNKIAYKKIRCCSYKNQWWTFLIFETIPNYQKLEKGDWIKIDGVLNFANNRVFAVIKSIEQINKIDYLCAKEPDIETEQLEAIEMENDNEEF